MDKDDGVEIHPHHIQVIGYHSAMRKKKILSLMTMWVELEAIFKRELNQRKILMLVASLLGKI